MNPIDAVGLDLLNGLANSSHLVDRAVHFLSIAPLAKGIPMMMLFWACWGASGTPRARLIAALGIAILTIAIGRALANFLPYRPRPIHSDWAVVNNVYDRIGNAPLVGWSSMPSDHAMLFIAMAVAMFLAHRTIGLVAIAYAIIVICLPRIYLGLHWPTDILIGGMIGAATVFLLAPMLGRRIEHSTIARLPETHGAVFYPAMFFITLETAFLFNNVRVFLRNLVELILP